MALTAQLLVNIERSPSVAEIDELRHAVYRAFGGSTFRSETNDPTAGWGLPFRVIEDISELSDRLPRQGTWLDLNLALRYAGPGYHIENIEPILAIAEWVESRIPTCCVWYGNDSYEGTLAPLCRERRQALINACPDARLQRAPEPGGDA